MNAMRGVASALTNGETADVLGQCRARQDLSGSHGRTRRLFENSLRVLFAGEGFPDEGGTITARCTPRRNSPEYIRTRGVFHGT